jgi:hypothetical protein
MKNALIHLREFNQMLFRIKPHRVKFFGVKLIGLIMIFTSAGIQASVSQSIDRTDIHAGESFVFTIQVDQDDGSEPDLSLIPKEFTIISNSQYQRMSNLNGRTNIIKGWKIKLSTLVTGKIVIPPIPIGNTHTKAINLFIKDTSHQVDLNGQKRAIFLEAKADQTESYVQQQIIFTVKLYRAVNTHYGRITEPSPEDSIVEKLGEDIQYDKMIDNTRYRVMERRYAIFPQKSGPLTISSINFTADVNDSSNKNGNRFLNTTRPISVTSKIHVIDVQPQPSEASSPWMPAAEVALADKWSSQSNELTVGEPVTWTILLYAQGLSESQIPEITLPKVEGLQFYPDTPQKERQINDLGILGQRIEKLAVIPSKQGTITIPEIKMTWWDTKSDSEKTATIASKTFTVLPGTPKPSTAVSSDTIGTVTEKVLVSVDPYIFYWKASTFGFAILWIITLLAYWGAQKSARETVIKRASNQTTKKKNEKEITQSELFKSLSQAIKQQKFDQIERYLLLWTTKLSGHPIHSLGALASSLDEPSSIEKINQLDQFRYSSQKADYQCDLSKGDLLGIAEFLSNKSIKNSDNVVPGLYDL